MNRQKPLTLLSKNIESIVVFVSTVSLFFILLFLSPGGPQNVDVLTYVNYGLYPHFSNNYLMLNRFFHILFQRLFLLSAPTPLLGIQIYWAFLISSVSMFIYINARKFTEQNNIIHGIVAVLLFLSFNALADNTGSTDVDLTAMFLVMFIVTLYLLYVRRGFRDYYLLWGMGLLFYFSIRTKETAFIASILFIGIFLVKDSLSHPAYWRSFLYVFAGLISGIIIFSLWTWIELGDPFFGFRPSQIIGYLNSWKGGVTTLSFQNDLNSWYNYAFASSLFIQFLLYTLSGIKTTVPYVAKRILWLLPLALLLFLTFTVYNKFGYTPRYFLPAFPILCILAPQFIEFKTCTHQQERFQLIGLFIGASLTIVIVSGGFFYLLHSKLDLGQYIYVLYYPLIITLLLVIEFLNKQSSNRLAVTTIALVLALLAPPLIRNIKVMILERPNQKIVQGMLYPFSTFRREIKYKPTMQFFIASDTWNVVGATSVIDMLTEDQNSTLSLFNLYFYPNEYATSRNFIDSAKRTLTYYDIDSTEYDYLVITRLNWENINRIDAFDIMQKYELFYDEQKLLVMLKKR